MQKTQRTLFIIFSVVVLAGTALFVFSGNKNGEVSVTQFDKDLAGGRVVSFTQVSDGYYAGLGNDTEKVIKSKEDWVTLWDFIYRNTTPIPNLPYVDFEKDQIIGVFKGIGDKTDYSIRISKIIDDDVSVWVFVETVIPGKTCPKTRNPLLGQPYQIIKIKLSEKPIQFHYEEIINECI